MRLSIFAPYSIIKVLECGENAYWHILTRKFKERVHLGDLVVEGRIILNCI